MDEDLAEMAALRKASRHQTHLAAFGDRAAVREQRRLNEQKRDKEQESRLREAFAKAHADEPEDTTEQAQDVDAQAMATMGMPLEFGKKKAVKADVTQAVLAQHTTRRQQEEAGDVDPAMPPLTEASDNEDSDDDAPMPASRAPTPQHDFKLPITHEAVLAGHGKPVAGLTIDHAGARLISGSLDGHLKFWDFGGMTQNLNSFRDKEAEEGHPVVAVSFSPTGSHFVCCTGSVQPKIFDREGFEVSQFVRGDMYLRDMKFTKGHTAYVTGGHWHPTNKEQILTSSVDGTLRLWSSEQPEQCLNTIKLQPAASRRITVSACCYSPDGALVAGGGNDGSLRLWNVKAGSKYLRPDKQVLTAHESGEEITGISIDAGNTMVVSRATDHTLKIWDLRKFSAPVKVFTDLENRYSTTSVIFDPLDRLILTGTSNNKLKGIDRGRVMVYNAKTLEFVKGISMSNEAVIRVLWHSTINQIFASCSDGSVRVLYSPEYSTKGILNSVGKRPAEKPPEDIFEYHNIKAPYHLPYFDTGASHQSRKIKIRNQDPTLTKMPEKPLEGLFGTGGRTYGSTMNQYIAGNIVKRKIDQKDQDPRAVLLAYADKAAADPMFFGRAYAKTQPVPVFDTSRVEEEEDLAAEVVSNKRLGQTKDHKLTNVGK